MGMRPEDERPYSTRTHPPVLGLPPLVAVICRSAFLGYYSITPIRPTEQGRGLDIFAGRAESGDESMMNGIRGSNRCVNGRRSFVNYANITGPQGGRDFPCLAQYRCNY